MKEILIIEKGICENFIFYLKLTARELLDLINYRKYVSSQQKVQSFGLEILEYENISLLPLFSKVVNHVLKNCLNFIVKKSSELSYYEY